MFLNCSCHFSINFLHSQSKFSRCCSSCIENTSVVFACV